MFDAIGFDIGHLFCQLSLQMRGRGRAAGRRHSLSGSVLQLRTKITGYEGESGGGEEEEEEEGGSRESKRSEREIKREKTKKEREVEGGNT